MTIRNDYNPTIILMLLKLMFHWTISHPHSCMSFVRKWNKPRCHINKWSFVIQWLCVTVVYNVNWPSWLYTHNLICYIKTMSSFAMNRPKFCFFYEMIFFIQVTMKKIWKVENLLLKSKFSIFHIFFQKYFFIDTVKDVIMR